MAAAQANLAEGNAYCNSRKTSLVLFLIRTSNRRLPVRAILSRGTGKLIVCGCFRPRCLILRVNAYNWAVIAYAFRAAKRAVQLVAVLLALPLAALSTFGRWTPMYATFAHALALVPGPGGEFLRAAYYGLTLRESSFDTRIGYGTFFVHSEASVGRNVSAHVQIASGRRQHIRDDAGRMSGSSSLFEVEIGTDCWIGTEAEA
jgi:hypothetical protein